ncbi:TetR/AcrR family transcriptional regulator [Parahaliea sp. F7430]|uniref:TetR/AcrR family transcriptional regulator n=1 Tax=Sediminihaliea albiluteola TaxID=2758564 RepID=A0A7W2TXI5_9GAMM|nr:TetR/AcrR family transcriptional regulator [Sediminihaliea albiluteola]MBA6413783.1 TetR/AcrR family transcriptional regulator [Sediminihaliea albiluteola]
MPRPLRPVVEARRNHIINVTRDMISEVGIEGITMRELAKRCNIAVATIYNNFGSSGKEAVIAAALQLDFGGRFEELDDSLSPAEKVKARISQTANDIKGPLRDYTKAVQYFYFHHQQASEIRAIIHDYSVSEFNQIVRQIEARGHLETWVDTKPFADDLVTQVYALIVKWSQGYIADRSLKKRLLQAVCLQFIAISKAKTRKEFIDILNN